MADASNNSNLIVARFYTEAVPDENESRKAGRPIFKDEERCEIRFAANKRTTGVFPAHEVFKWGTNPESGEREQVTYAMAYADQYRKFKAGQSQDQSGTPLSELPFLSASKRLELKALNIHTAEALAALDGTPLKQLGMGGREMKNQAQAYLDKASGSADLTAMAAESAAQKQQIADLQAQIEEINRAAAAGKKKAA